MLLPNTILEADYDRPRTILLIPSVSFGGLTAKYLVGLHFFEERNLFYLSCLKSPATRLIVALSEGFRMCGVDYFMRHISKACGLSIEDIKARLTIIPVPTDGTTALTRNLLDHPLLFHRIKGLIERAEDTVIDFWMVSDQDFKLACELGQPYYGLSPAAFPIDSKSGARRLFREIGIAHPVGKENLMSLSAAHEALHDLRKHTDAARFLLKINCEEGGNGIATIDRADISLPHASFRNSLRIGKKIPLDAFEHELEKQGCVVEECIESPLMACPSVKMEILPDGTARNLATHEQILRDRVYSGSRFPADPSYRHVLIETGFKIANRAAALGARGLLSVDFLATRNHTEEAWKLWGIEINARKSATTHPYYWTIGLTGATYHQQTGTLSARTGTIFYHASEYLTVAGLEKIPPEKILSAVEASGLDYDHHKQAGILVHMISSVPRFGKFGVTVIGHDEEEISSYWQGLAKLLFKFRSRTKI